MLVAGREASTLPAESRTSSVMSPKTWRFCRKYVMIASSEGFGPMNTASPFPQPPDAGMRSTVGCDGMIATGFASVSFVSVRSGVRSSTIQMPRPCVATTRASSRGWIARSRTATLGKSPPLKRAHCCPPSTEIHSPNSVPRNSSCGLTRSSLITCA